MTIHNHDIVNAIIENEGRKGKMTKEEIQEIIKSSGLTIEDIAVSLIVASYSKFFMSEKVKVNEEVEQYILSFKLDYDFYRQAFLTFEKTINRLKILKVHKEELEK